MARIFSRRFLPNIWLIHCLGGFGGAFGFLGLLGLPLTGLTLTGLALTGFLGATRFLGGVFGFLGLCGLPGLSLTGLGATLGNFALTGGRRGLAAFVGAFLGVIVLGFLPVVAKLRTCPDLSR